MKMFKYISLVIGVLLIGCQSHSDSDFSGKISGTGADFRQSDYVPESIDGESDFDDGVQSDRGCVFDVELDKSGQKKAFRYFDSKQGIWSIDDPTLINNIAKGDSILVLFKVQQGFQNISFVDVQKLGPCK